METMSQMPSETMIRAWARLLRAQHTALAKVEAALKAAKLPPLNWYDVLLELERSESGLRPAELEREMLMPQYGLSRLLDRIEADGYLARVALEEDRRGQRIVITQTGREMRRRMWPVYAGAIGSAVAARLSEDEAAILSGLLAKLIAP